VELTDWRGNNGLNPLIIGDVIDKTPCPGKGAACSLEAEVGVVDIVPGPAAEAPIDASCASTSMLVIQPVFSDPVEVNPCEFVPRGGAAIEMSAAGIQLVPAQRQENRLWTQPLYAPVRKLPKTAKTPVRAERSSPPVHAATSVPSTDSLSPTNLQPSDDSSQ
jgi:hypothetical protein